MPWVYTIYYEKLAWNLIWHHCESQKFANFSIIGAMKRLILIHPFLIQGLLPDYL